MGSIPKLCRAREGNLWRYHRLSLVIKLGDDLAPAEMCVGNDTTNRTRQTLAKKKGWPWLEGKGFAGSGVLGTWTAWDPRPVEIGLSVNGDVRQQASTELMVHSVESILGYLKDWYEPSPGDLVWTGTPEGVGAMCEGDQVECWMKNSNGEIISKLSAECLV